MGRKRKKRESNATAEQILVALDGLPSQKLLQYKKEAAKRGLRLSQMVAERIDSGVLQIGSDAQRTAKLERKLVEGEIQHNLAKEEVKSTLKRDAEDEVEESGVKRRKLEVVSRNREGDGCASANSVEQVLQDHESCLRRAGTESAQGCACMRHGQDDRPCNGNVHYLETPDKSKKVQDVAVLDFVGQQPQTFGPIETVTAQHTLYLAETVKHAEKHDIPVLPSRCPDGIDAPPDEFLDVPSTQDWQVWADSPVGRDALSSSPSKKPRKRDAFARQDSFLSVASSYDPSPTRPKKECCTEHSPCPPRWQATKLPDVCGLYYAVRQGRNLGIYNC